MTSTETILVAGVGAVVVGGVIYLVVTHKPAPAPSSRAGGGGICGKAATAGIAAGSFAAGVPAMAGLSGALGKLACSELPVVGRLVAAGAKEVAHLAVEGAKEVAHATTVAAKATEKAAVKATSVGVRGYVAVQTLGLSETKPGKVVVADAKKVASKVTSTATNTAKKAASAIKSLF